MKKDRTYLMCKLMIKTGRIDGMQEKLDLFFTNDYLTAEQYEELCTMLATEIAKQQGNG